MQKGRQGLGPGGQTQAYWLNSIFLAQSLSSSWAQREREGGGEENNLNNNANIVYSWTGYPTCQYKDYKDYNTPVGTVDAQ